MWWAYEQIFFTIFISLLKTVLALTLRLMINPLKRPTRIDSLLVEELAEVKLELIKADQRKAFS